MGCVLVFHWGALKLTAILVPFFAGVPITLHYKDNAIHKSQDIYHGHYIPQWGGPSLPLTPSAAHFRGSSSPPAPARAAAAASFPHSYSLEESHRLQIQPTSKAVFAKSLTKTSLSCPRPLLPRRVPQPGPQSAFLSSRVLHVGTRARAVCFSPRPAQGPRESEAWRRLLSGLQLSLLQSLHHGKNKIKFRKGGCGGWGDSHWELTPSHAAPKIQTPRPPEIPPPSHSAGQFCDGSRSPRTLNSTAGVDTHPFPTPPPKSWSHHHQPLS